MTERETSRSIDEQAADWIARRDRSQLSTGEAQELGAWLDGDPRRRGALLRASALALLSESAQALGPNFAPERFAPAAIPQASGVSRRQLLAWAGAGGAATAALVALGLGAPAFGAITTKRGEVRLVTLDDGSTVMLNTETSVRVLYSERVRRITLLYGEAYFTIVRDRRGPLLVDVGAAHVRAAPGTVRVRSLDGKPIDILVNQGAVTVQAGVSAPLAMDANMRIALPANAAAGAVLVPQTIAPDVTSRELAWRDGKVAFEGERLDQAAAEFARYSGTRIVITDPALASEPVSGLFAAGDPIGFSRAIAGIFDARMDVAGDVVTLAPKVPPTKK